MSRVSRDRACGRNRSNACFEPATGTAASSWVRCFLFPPSLRRDIGEFDPKPSVPRAASAAASDTEWTPASNVLVTDTERFRDGRPNVAWRMDATGMTSDAPACTLCAGSAHGTVHVDRVFLGERRLIDHNDAQHVLF